MMKIVFNQVRRYWLQESDISMPLIARIGTGGNNLPIALEIHETDRMTTMEKENMVYCMGNGQLCQLSLSRVVRTLDCMHDHQAIIKGGGDSLNNTIVRRLTVTECERLQGFPDGWTDIGDWIDSNGKPHKDADSPRYKAIGNSIALPFWQYLARRICAQYERDVTIGSLFDGIGGFPLVFEKCGARAVWASEIEEFPIAVTKKHFPENDDNEEHQIRTSSARTDNASG